MAIEEAIKILSEYVYEDKPCQIGLFDEATKLGIEALKRIRAQRKDMLRNEIKQLPGETDA